MRISPRRSIHFGLAAVTGLVIAVLGTGSAHADGTELPESTSVTVTTTVAVSPESSLDLPQEFDNYPWD